MRPIDDLRSQGAASRALLLAGLLAALLALRLVALWLNSTDLFFDEAQYWTWGQEPALGYYSKPPLIGWLIGAVGSVCGDSTFCVRLPAPILHTATAWFVYLLGARLVGPTVGFWSGLAFATLPGVSFSSGIISTDVPLLTAWAAALWAYAGLLQGPGWGAALALGLALGVGLNAKYAMGFFLVSLVVHMAVAPAARRLARDPRLWAALALGVALIVPNMAWNLANGFATFAHTADNAKWGGALLNIGKGLEFVGAQAGVIGPILAAGLVWTMLKAWREGLPEGERLLLAFTLPVLVLITTQAFISRAHANWAATAYVAGTVLVTATLRRHRLEGLLKASLALHVVVAGLLAVGTTFAGRFTLPVVGDPFQRTLGWSDMAEETGRILAHARTSGRPYRAVIADDRAITAELLYYLRRDPTPVLAWREGERPRDHYEMTRPYKDPGMAPVLLVATRRDADAVVRRFTTAEPVADAQIPAGLGRPRRVQFFSLSGMRPD